MNRVELSTKQQVRAGEIEPLECGIGMRPVACTPVAVAALTVAVAGTAYYAFRDYKTSHGYISPAVEMDNLESITAQHNTLSVTELTGAIRDVLAG